MDNVHGLNFVKFITEIRFHVDFFAYRMEHGKC